MGSSCRRQTSCPALPSERAPCATLCVSAPRRHGPAARGPCWASGDLGPGVGGGCHLCDGCKPCLPREPVRDGCSLSPADLVGFGWSRATGGCSRDRRGRRRGCRRARATAGSPLAAAATRRKAEAPNRSSTTTTRAARRPSTPSGGRWDRAAAFAGNSRWQPWFGLGGVPRRKWKKWSCCVRRGQRQHQQLVFAMECDSRGVRRSDGDCLCMRVVVSVGDSRVRR